MIGSKLCLDLVFYCTLPWSTLYISGSLSLKVRTKIQSCIGSLILFLMVSRFMTSSFLLIYTRSSEFGFLFYPLVYLRVWGNNLILECFLKRLSTGFSHQASVFKIHASVHVQLSPMTFCSARGEVLSQPAIGKPLQCRVYPTETKSLFHHFNVWNSRPFGWRLLR